MRHGQHGRPLVAAEMAAPVAHRLGHARGLRPAEMPGLRILADRQHQFVMLRARLAYTIARHQLRSLDVLEKLLLQVTRRNEARSYERFRDLFEAIVAYNE